MSDDTCDVCETNHAINTPHPNRIHPGPRTVRVRMSVAAYIPHGMSDGDVHASVQVVWRGFTDAEALSHSVCVASECGKLIGSAIIEADVPLIETPVVRGGVKP